MLSARSVVASVCRRARSGDDEAGAVLVIFAVGLVAVMLFGAMAIDLGNIAQTKVHAESAAQDAALSAVTDLGSIYAGGAPATVEAQAVRDAESYLITNFSSLAGANFTSGCAGALPAASVYVWPTANCFGFAPNLSTPTTMAVALPGQQVAYTLGRAGGLTSQAVGAVAYASISTADNGFLMPFAYLSGGGSGLQCLHTASGNSSANCTGFTTGNGQFGLLDSPRYRIFPGFTPSAGNDLVTPTNIVLGIDHVLNPDSSGASEVCDGRQGSPPNCPGYNNSPTTYDDANYAAPLSGQTINDAEQALFTGGQQTPDGSCILDPRLSHPDGFVASASCSADNPYSGPAQARPDKPWLSNDNFGSNYQLNGVHISRYLNSTGMTLTTGCKLPAGDTASNTAIDAPSGSGTVWNTPAPGATQSYDECLSGVMSTVSSHAAIFTAAIEQSPRFGIVPIVSTNNGVNAEQITGFAAAYLDFAFSKANKVGAIVAWIFPLSMIDPTPSSGGSLPFYLGGPMTVALCSLSAGNC